MAGTKARLVAALGAALAFAPAAHAGGPGLVIGATEDAVRTPTLLGDRAEMALIQLAGFRAVRVTQTWAPGETTISGSDAASLRSLSAAAQLSGIDVVTTILSAGSATTPLSAQDQADFAMYAASVVEADPELTEVIVGNEPNLNRYWMPQFNPDGSDAAAPAYEALLAAAYDALKAASPGVTVIGGAVSPRGGDVPGTGRDTHSPTAFIRDLGTAYRTSGRTTPIMDAFAFHPYEDNSSVAPITGMHPNTTTIALADYGKLVGLLADAFDGTAQRGSTLPIYYDEFGVESAIPPSKQSLYTAAEPAATRPVDEATQAAYYRQAIQLAFCQPNVRGLFLFHAFDETTLLGWQSGVYYADGTAKASLAPVSAAMSESRRGVVAACPGLRLTPSGRVTQRAAALMLTCDIDCSYVAQLYRLPGKLLASRTGRAVGGRVTTLSLRAPRVRASYRLRVSLTAPVNPGPAALLRVPVRPG